MNDSRKPKILLVNECSLLATGFATYGKEVLSRLYATHKFDLCELATYVKYDNPHLASLPWRIYANLPAISEEESDYTSDPLNQFGKWRFEDVLLDYKPDIVMSILDPWMNEFHNGSPLRPYFHWAIMPTVDSCFIAGTPILLNNCIKNIEEVNVGDYVINSDGYYNKVLKCITNHNDKKIIKITSYSFSLPIELTEDHPVLIIEKENQKWTHNSRIHRSSNHKINKSKFIKASEIKPGDYLIIPCPKFNSNIDKLDLLTLLQDYPSKYYYDDAHIWCRSTSHKINRFIPINEDISRLFGWFCAEGCVGSFTVMFSLNGETEQQELQFIDNIMLKYFGIIGRRVPNKNDKCESTIFSSSILRHVFTKIVNKGSYNIIVPEFIFSNNSKNIIAFLEGLFFGDGSDTHTIHNKRTISLSSASKQLMIGVYYLLIKLGILSSLSKCGKAYKIDVLNKHGQKLAQLFDWGNTKYEFSKFDNSKSWIDENQNAIIRVKQIQVGTQTNTVYNLQVDGNHTFIAGFAVHNCPLQEGWVNTYIQSDGCSAYSQFGIDTLKEQSGNTIKLIDIAGGGFDPQKYRPIPQKKLLRQKFNLPENAFIVGSVMRNQKRKLFPDLIEAFKLFLQKSPDSLRERSYLYLHTSYPDLGWDLPRLIKDSEIANHILFTYYCTHCKNIFCATFKDGQKHSQCQQFAILCPRCHTINAVLPNTQISIPQEALCEIYNLFDIYIQYAICEGLSLPSVEASACGIPIALVDYSAMSNVVRQCSGYPIKVHHAFRESETHAIRVYPDNEHLVEILTKFASLPESIRLKKGRDAYTGAMKYYTWNRIAKIWEDYFSSLKLENKWSQPVRLHQPDQNVPQGLSPDNLVNWAIINVLGEPEQLNTFWAMQLSRDIQNGFTQITFGGSCINEDSIVGSRIRARPFGPKDMLNMLASMCEKRNYWEKVRCGLIQRRMPIVNFVKKEE